MTVLVRQRTPYDCVPCCLAMVSGRTYEDVVKIIGNIFDPVKGVRDEAQALQRLGYKNTFESGEAVGDFVVLYRGFYISPEYFRSMAWGRRALVSVPSLNFKGGWHMIYWDGCKVLDPSPLETYERWDQLKPEYLTLFQERM